MCLRVKQLVWNLQGLRYCPPPACPHMLSLTPSFQALPLTCRANVTTWLDYDAAVSAERRPVALILEPARWVSASSRAV